MQRFLLQTSQNEHSLRSGVASDWRKHVLIHRRVFLVEQFARFLTSSLSCTAIANLFTEDGDGVYQSNIRLEDLTAVGEKIPPDVVLFVYQWYSWDQLLRYFWSSHEGQRCLRRLLREKRGLRISALKEVPVTQAMLRRKDRKILLDIFCYFELPFVLSGGHLDRWLDYLSMSGSVRGKKNRLRMELELVRNTSLHRLQVLNELTQRRP